MEPQSRLNSQCGGKEGREIGRRGYLKNVLISMCTAVSCGHLKNRLQTMDLSVGLEGHQR